MTDWSTRVAPSLIDFEALAASAWDQIPAQFRALASDLVIKVEDICEDQAILDELGIDNPFDLTGLYSGRDLAHRSVGDLAHGPDLVFLYRLAILAEWCEGEEPLGALVAHVLIHEVGHHFGLSDDDIDAIEADAGASGPVGGG